MGKRSISLVMAVAFLVIGVPMPAHAQVTNLALNPSFEEADDVIYNDPSWVKWATWNDPAGAASVIKLDQTEYIDGKQSLRIEPKGSVNWYFIVVNMTIPLTVGKTYTVSFWAKAESARPLTVQWKSGDNSVTWATTDFQLTNQWAEYTFTSASQNSQGKVEFLCAGSEVPFWLDFLYVYEGPHVAGIMPSGKASPGKATHPAPDTGAVDVQREAFLAWTPGQFAATHDVYLGTVLNDVNNADRSHPMGVLVSQGQDANTFDPPGRLELGRTYYWRVDEVNAAPSSSIYKGSVWNFTVEPVAYKIANITAKASSATATATAQNTVNNSGLDANDLQSTDTTTMWLTATNPSQPVWIQYDFDRIYEVSELWVWNYNTQFEDILGIGVKDATIQYSADGTTWKTLGDFQFAQGTGEPGYAHNTTISFGGVAAKSVKITVKNAWAASTKFGLSEVRFFYIPTFAREPKPATGAAGIAPDVTLNWRAGREAASHNIYIGTDPNALMLAGAAATNSYAPTGLSLGTKYYWRVDEVNTAEATSTWASDVWSFTTTPYLVVDDMEGYTDNAPNRIFDAWVDGWNTTTNGCVVGNDTAPFAEQTIVHGGKQAMPLKYNNSGAITASEATRTFDTAQDWTRNGVKTLTLWFRGEATNTTGVPMSVKLTDQSGKTAKVTFGSAAGEDVTLLADPAWTEWNIPLSGFSGVTLSKIKSMTIGLTGAGSGKLYFDDIVLYPARDTTVAAPVLVGWWKLDNDAKDSSGNGNNGTLFGAPTWVAAGKIGAALSFNGTTDYVDCGNGASVNITDKVTLSVWIKPNAVGNSAYQDYVGKSDHSYAIKHNSSNVFEFVVYDGTWYGATIPVTGPAYNGTWHHLAGTYDGTQLKLYVDGKIVASLLRTGVIAPTTYSVNIARNSEQTTRLYSGAIDDARIYRGALPKSEVLKLANP